MSCEDFIKSITSKDIDLSKHTIEKLIKNIEIENFKKLCNSSEFIFPFIKDRIIKDFVKLIAKENLNTVFEFSKIYSSDFEDLIVNSWLKFACEDLTDSILEIFESGTNEQKAYGAKYFSCIKDSLALDYLNKEANSNFSPLKINCAQTLRAFGDKNALNTMMNIVQNSCDDFEQQSAYEFITAYGTADAVKFVIENAKNSPFIASIVSNLLDYNDLNELKKVLKKEEITEIFNILIDNYPENILLDTILYYQIFDFIKLIETYNNQFALNSLITAKIKFLEFQSNDAYLFDLDKNSKNEINKISQYFQSKNYDISGLQKELEEFKNTSIRFDCALFVVKELRLVEYSQILASYVNTMTVQPNYIVSIVNILKEFNKIDLINKNKVDEIKDPNIRALVLSYIS